MPPRAVLLSFLLLSFLVLSCASASDDASPDGGRADGRTREDAGVVDAAVEPVVDAASDAASPPDAAPPIDAAPEPAIVLITEIVDADLTGGLPKFVEITNLGGVAADLSEFSLGVFSNGGFTLNGGASMALAGSLAPSDSFVVSFENGDTPGSSSFLTVYGEDADHVGFGAIINGNDAVVLYLGVATGNGSDATVVDRYGVVGADGVGQGWEYTDGFASRAAASTSPATTFAPADWVFSGPAALESATAVEITAATSPGSH